MKTLTLKIVNFPGKNSIQYSVLEQDFLFKGSYSMVKNNNGVYFLIKSAHSPELMVRNDLVNFFIRGYDNKSDFNTCNLLDQRRYDFFLKNFTKQVYLKLQEDMLEHYNISFPIKTNLFQTKYMDGMF